MDEQQLNKVPNCPILCYWDTKARVFWTKNTDGLWIKLAKDDMKEWLKVRGVGFNGQRTNMKVINQMICDIQDLHSVSYAGPIAGYYPGLHPGEIGNKNILVTEGYVHLREEQGDWSDIRSLWEGLLGPVQLPYFYSWLKLADECFTGGFRMPGQALILAGPPGCGKSLTQLLITEIFGGRSSKPYSYMMGDTDFNSELMEAEHLMLEDEIASDNYEVRQRVGSLIKQCVANEGQRCHGKHLEAIQLRPIRRLSITVNDEPSHLAVIPPLDESLKDKVILFKCSMPPVPFPLRTPKEKADYWDKLKCQIRATLYFLRREWVVPEDLRDERFGVKAFHNLELFREVQELSPATKVLEMIDLYIINGEPIEATPTEWVARFKENSQCRDMAFQLFKSSASAGKIFSTLAKQYPHRVTHYKSNGTRLVEVKPDPTIKSRKPKSLDNIDLP